MNPKPQIPSSLDFIRPAINAIVAARPGALKHINYGTGAWSHVIEGWRAQAALAVRRLADGALSGRLALAKGDALRRLAQSEYDALRDDSPSKSHGTLSISRFAGSYPQGVIPKGTRLRRPSLDGVPLPVASADYVTDQDVVLQTGSPGPWTLNFTAVRAGGFSNSPTNVLGATLPAMDTTDLLFDPNIVLGSYFSAGGSDGLADDDVRRYASAFAVGQYGPNRDALVVAALRQTGARHVAVKFDPSTATENLYIFDQSWCSGLQLANSYWQQLINDSGFVGFGCKATATGGIGKLVNVVLTVRLRDPQFAADTTGIDESIRNALTSYFDLRRDFWIFKLNALRGVVSRCDKRILRCTTAQVYDSTGAVVAEPTQDSTPLHYHLANNAVTTTYLGPV